MTSEEVLKENKASQNRFSSMLAPERVTGVKRKSESINDGFITKVPKTTRKFIYGNYSRYYGYRKGHEMDPRIKVFEQHKDLFTQKNILDIGCNDGSVTLEIASRFSITSITGIDIDKELIGKAKKNHKYMFKKSLNPNLLSVSFEDGNYVLLDESLLETETPRFDTILCLSVTKWIHLNFGDDGIKMMFKRVFAQLRPGGAFVLEAQPYEGYRRRKRLTETTLKHFKSIKLFPKDFKSYLLSSEIGFTEYFVINESRSAKGFDRSIQVFVKEVDKNMEE